MQTIDVNAFTPINAYQKGVRTFLDVIKSTPPAQGFDEVLSPGDFEARNRNERLKNGIEIPDTIYRQLLVCAEKLNVPINDDIIKAEDMTRYETT